MFATQKVVQEESVSISGFISSYQCMVNCQKQGLDHAAYLAEASKLGKFSYSVEAYQLLAAALIKETKRRLVCVSV
jgi:hypothetical protein